jgi:energy-coupling factor transporter transmembrane protein EcfT
MSALFHLGFEAVKISALSAVYSSIIYLFLHKLKPIRKLASVRFKSIFLTLSGLLFIFLFTYYGNHGLGDEANIPLGHHKTMESSDGYAYFAPEGMTAQIKVDSFLVKNDNLCIASPDGIYVYNLATDNLKNFSDRPSYQQYAQTSDLPTLSQFKKFDTQYREYWNTWRFWTLP